MKRKGNFLRLSISFHGSYLYCSSPLYDSNTAESNKVYYTTQENYELGF